MRKFTLIAIALAIGIFVGAHFDASTKISLSSPIASIAAATACDAPSGAMTAIQYQEIFIGKFHDLKFDCIRQRMPTACGLYLCTKFTAIDADDKHVIGYVWRDVFNKPEAKTCSPDGGKSGSFYGECPVGTPVATVYDCPWCAPHLDAQADVRGINSK